MKQKHWTDAYSQMVRGVLLLTGCLLLVCAIALVMVIAMDNSHSTPTPAINAIDTIDTAHTQEAMGDTQAIPSGSVTYDHVILPETPDAGMAYQDKLIFVGDSLTAHMVSRGGLTGGALTTQVWHTENNILNLSSEVTSAKIIYPQTKAKMTIAEAAALAKPDILIVTLGLDWGVAYLNEADFKACYTALVEDIQEVSPDTTVILQSIFPVTADYSQSHTSVANEKIDTCNTWVKAVADACDCPYLDTQSVLKGQDNALPAEYNNAGDGIHLTAEAYQIILQYIRTHAYTE